MAFGAAGDGSVAVVIPAKAPTPWLADAIRSVLDQTFPVAECVIVDDGSPGEEIARTVAAAGDQRVRYVRQDHGGVASARNLGVRNTTADLVCFLDADDLWMAEKVSRQVDVLGRRPRAGVVVTSYSIIDERRGPRGTVTVTGKTLRDWVLGEGAGMAFASTAMVRRQLFDQLGGFDETLSVSADLDFALRAASVSSIEIVPEPSAVYRKHRGQMHIRYDDLQRDCPIVFERHLARPRDRRRAMANLHYRAAWRLALRREAVAASRALRAVIGSRPLTLVDLPMRVAVDRLRRRGRRPAADHVALPDELMPR